MLDSNQKKKFVAACAFGFEDLVEIGENKIPKTEYAIKNPREVIWASAMFCLAIIYMQKETARSKRKAIQYAADWAAKVLEKEHLEP